MNKETTIIKFEKETDWGKSFISAKGERVYIKQYQEGNLVLDTSIDTIHHVSQFVEGCFAKGSNVSRELSAAYSTDNELKQISFKFNGVEITAIATTTADNIVKQLYDGYEADTAKRKAEYEEYKKTLQYAIDMKENARKETIRKTIEAEVIHIDNTTEMEFKDDAAKEKWDEFVEINSKDGYSAGVVKYARRWAKYMQAKIAKGERLTDIADSTHFDADIEGITGFMYGGAVNALSQFWKHGEELRKWHNKGYGYEGDGCVNPAVLTIG